MSGVGIILNPRSHRNRRGLAECREIVRQYPGVAYCEIGDVSQISEALSEFAARGVDVIGISGGDGTVQGVITALLNGGPFDRQPSLAILPAGMTNLIAADVGLRGRSERALMRLCQSGTAGGPAGKYRTLHVLSLQRTPQEAPIHGMFMGTAAFYRAVMLTYNEVHPLGVERHFAVALSIAVAVFRLFARRNHPKSLWHGDKIALGIDDLPVEEREYLLFLATTLDHLILGLMPFWGEGVGSLRYTSIDFPPKHLVRALWHLAAGRPQRWLEEAGYRSGIARECRLTQNCPIIFDGEIVTPEDGTPVVVRSDRQVTFWQDD